MTTEKYMEESIKLHSQGYIYAGLILGKNGEKDYHLWLHPETYPALLTWDEAFAWSASLQCKFPTRREHFLLLANCPDHFEKNWYWSSDQYDERHEFAWMQNFANGNMEISHRSNEKRVRAVRRVYTETTA